MGEHAQRILIFLRMASFSSSFSAMLPEKSAAEPQVGAAGSLTEIYDKLAQRACSMRVIRTHTCTGKLSLMRERARADFSLIRASIRSIPKFY